ncbi:hypothetical protein U9M48_043191 [Paspalum notatum var. saurae]|uniref:Uncharacterized protein n=1 Tax=Paspalum notatum var. saurae TaxID=547442 RepID=A0AAQ3XIE0_PASNO
MAPTYAVFEDQPPFKKTTVSYASNEEDYGSFVPQEETKSDYRSLASAKPLTEFEKMSWMPVDFGDTLKCAGPLPTEDLVEEEELFPPEVPLRKSDDSQDTGVVLQKLFQEEELDSDFVSEVKQVIGVKPESSLTEEVIIQLQAEESSTRISCSINKEELGILTKLGNFSRKKRPRSADQEEPSRPTPGLFEAIRFQILPARSALSGVRSVQLGEKLISAKGGSKRRQKRGRSADP